MLVAMAVWDMGYRLGTWRQGCKPWRIVKEADG
jgi:hypothetical protein